MSQGAEAQARVLHRLEQALHAARTAFINSDDDAWHSAMHALREYGWEGKEIIHEKRRGLAQPAAKRSATSDLQSLGLEESQ